MQVFVLIPPPLHPDFGGVPITLDQVARVRVRQTATINLNYSAVKLFSKYSNLCDNGA